MLIEQPASGCSRRRAASGWSARPRAGSRRSPPRGGSGRGFSCSTWHWPGRRGCPLIPALRQKSPQTKVILLTDGASEARTLEALAHGARGYLDKALLTTFLARAVRVVDAGEAWVPRKMVARIMDRLAGLTTWAGKTA